MGQNIPPVRDDRYFLMNSITETSQHPILKSLVQIHCSDSKKNYHQFYSVFHKTHPFFPALHTATLLKHQFALCSGGKRHFGLQGDHKNMIHFYMNWY